MLVYPNHVWYLLCYKVEGRPRPKQNEKELHDNKLGSLHIMKLQLKNILTQAPIISKIILLRYQQGDGSSYQHLEVHLCVVQMSSFFHDPELQSL